MVPEIPKLLLCCDHVFCQVSIGLVLYASQAE
uniref:Uncharacterized protein n=1 Tax=Arundo donax TaxID=35708 RepID=A0A0A9GGW9_ARUDO